jgi:hypothetical protein
MIEKFIDPVAQKVIDEYQHLKLGKKTIITPYYINTNRNKDLRAMVGKGTPDEIIMEARIWEKLKGVHFKTMSESEIKQFLMDIGIGIDCSGFVSHVLDSLVLKNKNKHLWRVAEIPQKDLFSKLKYLLKPVEKLGADVLTNQENSIEIAIKDVRPGDLIRSKWKKNNTHHIQIITKVVYEDNQIPTLIEYTHSTPYYGESNGVKTGEIKITDIDKTLKEQEWLEVDKFGVNFTLEGFLNNVEDNGLRRLKSLT